MEIDTLILILFTSAAFGWYLALRISDTRQYSKELVIKERENNARAKGLRE